MQAASASGAHDPLLLWSPPLPRYFFHAFDSENLPDREGSELSDLAIARLEAVRKTGELLRDKVRRSCGLAAVLVIFGAAIGTGLLLPF